MTAWKASAIARYALWAMLLGAGLLGMLLGFAGLAQGHGPHMTPAQEAWLDRQRARDGTKCCDTRDVHVGEAVEWRMQAGGYQVRIGETWHAIPPGRILAPIAGDPSPFGARALLFYTPNRSGGPPSIWCFQPEPLM